MPTAKDGEKSKYVISVKIGGGCRDLLEKFFKQNLKGGETYEVSCHWLNGIKLVPSRLAPRKLEEIFHGYDNDDIEDTDTTDDYSSLFKKVLIQNNGGGLIHKLSYNWFTGSRLTPIAIFPMLEKESNPDTLLPAAGLRSILDVVLDMNLRSRGIMLHEYSCGRWSANLTPIFPQERASPILYDHRTFYVHQQDGICQHFIRSTGVFAWIVDKIVIQPHRMWPGTYDHQHHQTGPVKDQE